MSSHAPCSPAPSADRRGRPQRRRADRGFTMVELLVVVVVLTVALTMVSGTMASAAKLGPLQRQRARAAEASREMLELLRVEPYHRLYSLYNVSPEDDPGGPGTAPGPHFAVEGLPVAEGDADGMCGRVRFPGQGGVVLREDVEDGTLGLPRDLDGDGVIEETDVSETYTILPVEVIVEWEANDRVQRFEIQTMFAEPPK